MSDISQECFTVENYDRLSGGRRFVEISTPGYKKIYLTVSSHMAVVLLTVRHKNNKKKIIFDRQLCNIHRVIAI